MLGLAEDLTSISEVTEIISPIIDIGPVQLHEDDGATNADTDPSSDTGNSTHMNRLLCPNPALRIDIFRAVSTTDEPAKAYQAKDEGLNSEYGAGSRTHCEPAVVARVERPVFVVLGIHEKVSG